MRSLITALSVVAALLLAGGQASAQGPCVDTTVGAIEATGLPPTFSCTIDNATLSNFGFTSSFTTISQAQVDFDVTAAGVVSVSLEKGPLATLPFGNNTIGYTITASSGFQIVGTTLSLDVMSGNATVPTNTIVGNNSGMHTLSLTSGSSETASAVFSPGDTSDVNFVRNFVNTPATVLNSITNDWTVSTKAGVPEPMSLSLLVLGLAGLGFARKTGPRLARC